MKIIHIKILLKTKEKEMIEYENMKIQVKLTKRLI